VRPLSGEGPGRPIRHAAAIAALVVVVVLGAVLLALTPSYSTNDDPVMAMIASGSGIATSSDPHLVFSSALIGRTLGGLYDAAPHLPWYGLYLLSVQALSHVALLTVLLVSAGLGRGLLAFGLYFLAVGLPFATELQFTSTAMLASLAGGLGLLSSLRSPNVGATATGLAGLVLVLGSLVRFQGFALSLFLLLPAALLCLPRPMLRRRALAATAVAFIPALGLHAWDRSTYRAPEWREFLDLNDAVRDIVDRDKAPYSAETAAAYERVGWSANDAALIWNWLYFDQRVFTAARMRQLVRLVSPRGTPLREPGVAADRFRVAVQRDLLKPRWLLLPMVLAALVGIARPDERQLRALGATAFLCLAVAAFLAFDGHAPAHVVHPVLAAPCGVVLLLRPRDAGTRGARARAWLVGLLVAGALVISVGRAVRVGREAAARNRELRSSLAAVDPSLRHLHVAWGTAFPYEAVLPLEDAAYLSSLRLYSIGWPQRSPVSDRMLKSFAIDDLVLALFCRPDVSLIARPAQPLLLEAYAQEHLGFDGRLALRRETSSFSEFQGTGSSCPS
jgi:hypothetical protein